MVQIIGHKKTGTWTDNVRFLDMLKISFFFLLSCLILMYNIFLYVSLLKVSSKFFESNHHCKTWIFLSCSSQKESIRVIIGRHASNYDELGTVQWHFSIYISSFIIISLQQWFFLKIFTDIDNAEQFFNLWRLATNAGQLWRPCFHWFQ